MNSSLTRSPFIDGQYLFGDVGNHSGGDIGPRPAISRVYGCRSKKAYPVSLWLDSGLSTEPD